MLSTTNNEIKLLEIISEGTGLSVGNLTNKELFKYIKQQIKDSYVKPPRLSGRIQDIEGKEYRIPMGVFNLGNNSIGEGCYRKMINEPKKEEEEKGKEIEIKDKNEEGEEEEIEIKNHFKMVDGKLVFCENEQPDMDYEEEHLNFNLEVKNDLPYQIYRKIQYFGRLTEDELFNMYRAISKEMLCLIIHDMINKRYLKKVKEKDIDVVFNDNATSIEEFTKIVEKDIETLEIVAESERRNALEEKKSNI